MKIKTKNIMTVKEKDLIIEKRLKLAKEYKTKPTKEVYDNIQIIDKQLEDFYVNRNKLLT